MDATFGKEEHPFALFLALGCGCQRQDRALSMGNVPRYTLYSCLWCVVNVYGSYYNNVSSRLAREMDEDWWLFATLFFGQLPLVRESASVVMSVRQQGLLHDSIDLGGDEIQHRFCCYHLRLNIICDINKGIKGTFRPISAAWTKA